MGWTKGVFLLASVTDEGEVGGEYSESLTTALGLPPPNGEKDFFGIVAEGAPSLVICSEVGVWGDGEIGWSTDVSLLTSFVEACEA